MAKIPEQPTLTPEQAYEQLQTWFSMQQQLASIRTAEVLARGNVAGYYFPEPEEGTNRFDIGGGFDLKMDHKVNRTVDEAALLNVTAAQVQALKLPMDELFEQKWALKVGGYRTLNDAQRLFVDGLLDIKPGTPGLSIVPQANVEAQAAHVAKAEAKGKAKAAPAAPKYDVNTGAEEDTVVGQYFKDSDGAWWLLDDEWLLVENAETLAELEAQVAPKPKATRKPRKKKGE